MKRLFIILAVATLGFVACNNSAENKTAEDTTAVVVDTTATVDTLGAKIDSVGAKVDSVKATIDSAVK